MVHPSSSSARWACCSPAPAAHAALHSPVMAVSARTHLPVKSDTRATASVMPAEGPSLGTAPAGWGLGERKCGWPGGSMGRGWPGRGALVKGQAGCARPAAWCCAANRSRPPATLTPITHTHFTTSPSTANPACLRAGGCAHPSGERGRMRLLAGPVLLRAPAPRTARCGRSPPEHPPAGLRGGRVEGQTDGQQGERQGKASAARPCCTHGSRTPAVHNAGTAASESSHRQLGTAQHCTARPAQRSAAHP